MYLVVHKYFLVFLNWLGCNKKNLVVYKLEPCIAQPPWVAVGESSDKMISNIPIHGIPLSRKTPRIKAEGTSTDWFKMRVMTLSRQASLNQQKSETEKHISTSNQYTSWTRRSASGIEIFRPPYWRRIWPVDADSRRKTPKPAFRIRDCCSWHATRMCLRLFLYFRGKITDDLSRTKHWPMCDQSNFNGAWRLRINSIVACKVKTIIKLTRPFAPLRNSRNK